MIGLLLFVVDVGNGRVQVEVISWYVPRFDPKTSWVQATIFTVWVQLYHMDRVCWNLKGL